MKSQAIWYDPATGSNYADVLFKCNVCSRACDSFFFICIGLGVKAKAVDVIRRAYHENCFLQRDRLPVRQEQIIEVYYSPEVPKTAQIRLLSPLELVDGKVGDILGTSEGLLIDRTKHAGRRDSKASLQVEYARLMMEERDKVKPDSLLADMALSSKPAPDIELIDLDTKHLLTNKSPKASRVKYE